jgi:ABC-type glycerol-3-phosphate transport system substrate-binding protein
MARCKMSRRQFVGRTAAAASLMAAPFVRTAGAAGSLSLALWDHWVPGGNTAMTEICQAWADKEKVSLQIDYLSTQGNKLYLTIAAEALAKSGHDLMDFSAWEPPHYEASLEPLDEVMAEVMTRNEPVSPAIEYLAKPKGKWVVVPGIRGTLCLPPAAVSMSSRNMLASIY